MFPLVGCYSKTGATSPFAREKVAPKQKNDGQMHRLTRGAPGKFGL